MISATDAKNMRITDKQRLVDTVITHIERLIIEAAPKSNCVKLFIWGTNQERVYENEPITSNGVIEEVLTILKQNGYSVILDWTELIVEW